MEDVPSHEKHFRNESFAVLIGAPKILAKDYEIGTDEIFDKGGFNNTGM